MTLEYTEAALAVIEAEVAALWLIVVNEDANLTSSAMNKLDSVRDFINRLYAIGENS